MASPAWVDLDAWNYGAYGAYRNFWGTLNCSNYSAYGAYRNFWGSPGTTATTAPWRLWCLQKFLGDPRNYRA